MAEKIKEKPSWFKFSEKEIKTIVLKLGKQGLTSEKIGLILRDQYGIPSVKIANLKISKILKEQGIEKNPDLTNLENKLEKLRLHEQKNKQDKTAKRKISEITSRIRRLKKYSQRKTKKG